MKACAAAGMSAKSRVSAGAVSSAACAGMKIPQAINNQDVA
jgi:hypothetical protein